MTKVFSMTSNKIWLENFADFSLQAPPLLSLRDKTGISLECWTPRPQEDVALDEIEGVKNEKTKRLDDAGNDGSDAASVDAEATEL